jgi:hypothetical protein
MAGEACRGLSGVVVFLLVLPSNQWIPTTTLEKQLGCDILACLRAAGVITTNAGGSVTSLPNPSASRRDRFDFARSQVLTEQRRREELAKVKG